MVVEFVNMAEGGLKPSRSAEGKISCEVIDLHSVAVVSFFP